MSYGSIFLPKGERLQSNIQQVYNELLEKDIRSGIVEADPHLHKLTQELSRLYSTAPDDPNILRRAHYAHSNSINSLNHSSISINSNNSLQESAEGRHKHVYTRSPKKTMPITATLLMENRRPGGKYNPPHIVDSYETPIIATVSQSAYNANTPKMWPKETQFVKTSKSRDYDSSVSLVSDTNSFGSKPYSRSLTHSIYEQTGQKPPSPLISDRPCSKSGAMSDLQRTLHECGRLQIVEDITQKNVNSVLNPALKHHRKKMESHIKWLEKSPNFNEIGALEDNQKFRARKLIRSDDSVSSHSTLSGISKGSGATSSSNSAKASTLSPLDISNLGNSSNVFRHDKIHHTSKVKYCRSLPKALNPRDPMDYKEEMRIQSYNMYNACIQPSIGIGQVPSQHEVTQILTQLTRKQVMCYEARIVECATLMKALKDTKHETPGFQAIISLHNDFVQAANVNMNPFLLSKKQIFAIIQKNVPWLEERSIGRLLTSFDATNTGIIRYVRISSTLLCCFETAMIKLACALEKDDQKWSQYYISNDSIHLGRLPQAKDDDDISLKSRLSQSMKSIKSKNDLSNMDVLTENEWKEYRGEVFVIRTLHQMYCACGGATSSSITSNSQINGSMKLEDIKELFSCCVTSTDEEKRMDELLRPMVQYLLKKLSDRYKKPGVSTDETLASSMKAEKVLAFNTVRSLFSQLTVDMDTLIDAVLVHPVILREFIRQVRQYRKLAEPVIYNGK